MEKVKRTKKSGKEVKEEKEVSDKRSHGKMVTVEEMAEEYPEVLKDLDKEIEYCERENAV